MTREEEMLQHVAYAESATNLNSLSQAIFGMTKTLGWIQKDENGHFIPRSIPIKIALMHSELSEALEAARKGEMSNKLLGRTGLEEEYADIIVRVLDSAGELNMDIHGTILAKLRYNASREDHKLENRNKPGGKKF